MPGSETSPYDDRNPQENPNDTFNRYLGINSDDAAILKKHSDALLLNADRFAQTFYNYLFQFPATANVLENYQEQGGHLEHLIKMQLEHLHTFLSGVNDKRSANKLLEVGRVHYEQKIAPVWVMGAYLIYFEHLRYSVANADSIPLQERDQLATSLQKFLFRDMGLMMEGYWETATAAIRSEQVKVAELQAQINALLTNIPQILWSVDVTNNTPIYISPTTSEICNLGIEMPIPCLGWTHESDRAIVIDAWQKALAGNRVEVESRVQEPGKEPKWFRRTFYPYRDESGKVVRIDGLMDDTTERKKMLSKLQSLATTDSLTGLANRSLFNDRLTQAIAFARRNKVQAVVMLMDLDHFKEINDTLGHPVGDHVLCQVAHRLRPLLRDTDTLARLGGDEFAIVLSATRDGETAAKKVSEMIKQEISQPFVWGEHEMYLDIAIGVAIYPSHGSDVDTLVSRADLAMYSAKHKAIGAVVYQPGTGDAMTRRLQFAGDLRRALDHDEFVLFYQPKIDLRARCVRGFEALIRWRHPELGLILPGQFIDAAERSGLIHPMTEWALSSLGDEMSHWNANGHRTTVALNVSASSLQNPQLLERLNESLSVGQLSKYIDQLEVEITENTLMADIERGARALEQLKKLGVSVAIDDFGTGYSSLAYLRSLPIRTIKLDKSFILQMEKDVSDAAIVRSTIELAHNLGCDVVAEGVESQQTYDMLTDMNCDGAQGFFMCEPLPSEGVLSWLRNSPWAFAHARN